jgi:hypothetical protein
LRDPGAVNGVGRTVGGAASDPAAADSSTHEPFVAIDAGARPGTPNWIHIEPRQAEAGFQDPALGWVGVRADASAGQIHATVLPGSSDAAQVLGGHMAGLNAHLAEAHAPVQTLTLATPEGREATFGTSQNPNQSMGQGQGMSQNGGQDGPSHAHSHPQSARSAVTAQSETHMSPNGFSPSEGSVGNHISVMA